MTNKSATMSPRRRRTLGALAALSIVALLAAAAWILWRSEISIGSEFSPKGATDGGAQVATTQFSEAANWTSSSDQVSLAFDSTEYGPGWEATAPLRVRLEPENSAPGRVVGLNVDTQGGPNTEGLSYDVYEINPFDTSATIDCSTYNKSLIGGAGSLSDSTFTGDTRIDTPASGTHQEARLCITVKANENLAPADGPTTVSWTVVAESR